MGQILVSSSWESVTAAFNSHTGIKSIVAETKMNVFNILSCRLTAEKWVSLQDSSEFLWRFFFPTVRTSPRWIRCKSAASVSEGTTKVLQLPLKVCRECFHAQRLECDFKCRTWSDVKRLKWSGVDSLKLLIVDGPPLVCSRAAWERPALLPLPHQDRSSDKFLLDCVCVCVCVCVCRLSDTLCLHNTHTHAKHTRMDLYVVQRLTIAGYSREAIGWLSTIIIVEFHGGLQDCVCVWVCVCVCVCVCASTLRGPCVFSLSSFWRCERKHAYWDLGVSLLLEARKLILECLCTVSVCVCVCVCVCCVDTGMSVCLCPLFLNHHFGIVVWNARSDSRRN